MTQLVNSNGNAISGTTAQRDDGLRREPGETYFDTTLGLLLMWTGTAWQASNGNTPLGDAGYGKHNMIWYKSVYDSLVDVKTTAGSPVTPVSSVVLPAGFIIYGGMIEVLTVGDSAGDTCQLGITAESANDLQASAAVSGAPWSTLGMKAIVPVMTAASAIQCSVARTVKVTIAIQNLVACKFNIHIVGMQGL